jgi:hypothetical protein
MKDWILTLPRNLKLNIIHKIHRETIHHPALKTFRRRNLPLSWIVMRLKPFRLPAGVNLYTQGDDISSFYMCLKGFATFISAAI